MVLQCLVSEQDGNHFTVIFNFISFKENFTLLIKSTFFNKGLNDTYDLFW